MGPCGMDIKVIDFKELLLIYLFIYLFIYFNQQSEYKVFYRVTQKNGKFWKTQQNLKKKSKKKNLLTEIEPLQLAF